MGGVGVCVRPCECMNGNNPGGEKLQASMVIGELVRTRCDFHHSIPLMKTAL